mgnify:CR=1 FL=1
MPTINKNTTAFPVKQNAESDSSSTEQVNPPETIIESDKSPSINISEAKPAVQVPVAEKPLLSSDKDHLLFTFDADSWVKVVDGSGRLLLEQLKKAGSEQIVSGKKPFSIVIGNASGVNLTYNDKPIDMSTYKKQDGTARFKLE